MEANFTDESQLPAVLQAKDVRQFLGLSRAATYNLMRSEGFPLLKLGKRRMVVPKAAFLKWIDKNVEGGTHLD